MFQSFRMRLPQEIPTEPCIIKILAGKKFFIWKVKDLVNQSVQISNDIDRKIRKGMKDKDLFTGLVNYIIKSRVVLCHIEVIFKSNNIQELIDFEQLELNKNIRTTNCLNTEPVAYQSEWIKSALNKARTDTFSPSNVPMEGSGGTSLLVAAKKSVKQPKEQIPTSPQNDEFDISDLLDVVDLVKNKR